jgi:hypothetical protein
VKPAYSAFGVIMAISQMANGEKLSTYSAIRRNGVAGWRSRINVNGCGIKKLAGFILEMRTEGSTCKLVTILNDQPVGNGRMK